MGITYRWSSRDAAGLMGRHASRIAATHRRRCAHDASTIPHDGAVTPRRVNAMAHTMGPRCQCVACHGVGACASCGRGNDGVAGYEVGGCMHEEGPGLDG